MPDQQRSLIKIVIISIAIIIASLILASAINNGTHYIGDAIGNNLNYIGNNISATTAAGRTLFDEYLSEYEAAAFIKVSADDFGTFIKSGELDGTFTVIQEGYIFSKEKLTQWMERRIENK